MVEELAEEREEAVERRRQAGVRRDVGDEQALGSPAMVELLVAASVGVARLPNVVMSSACASTPSGPANVVPVSSAVP